MCQIKRIQGVSLKLSSLCLALLFFTGSSALAQYSEDQGYYDNHGYSYSGLLEDNAKLLADMVAIKREILSLTKAKSDLENELAALRQENSNSKSQLSLRIEGLLKERNALAEVLSQTKDSNQNLAVKLIDLQKVATEFRKENQFLQDQLADFTNNNAKSQAQLNSEAESLLEKNIALKEDLDKANKTKASLEQNISSLNDSYASSKTELNKRIESLDEQNSALTKQLSQANDSNQSLSAQLTELKNTAAALKNDNQNFQDQLAYLVND
ncbi:MAG: hypothetical protein ABH872_02035, partial [Candidatus Omnitrophota bacterium]